MDNATYSSTWNRFWHEPLRAERLALMRILFGIALLAQQMIDAQNEYRRKRGAKEITEADVQRQAMEDERLRMRGRGPFAQAIVEGQRPPS